MAQQTEVGTSTSPYLPMFEGFRTELDEHHDRREKVIKASRDITAASKKMSADFAPVIPVRRLTADCL
jgi:hypothetical protein